MPLVTICIPTYNRPRELEMAIESCINQTFQDFLIRVGDDSANTLTENLIASLPSKDRILYKRNQPSLGQAGNVNELFLACQSKYLVLLHDDDLLMPNALELMVGAAQDHPDCVAVYGKQYLMTQAGALLYPESESLNRKYFRTSSEGNRVQDPIWSALVQQFPNDAYLITTDVAQITLYSAAPEVGEACDTDFGFRVARRGPFFFVDAYTGIYRVSDNSASSRGLRIIVSKTYKLIEKLELAKCLEHFREERLRDLAQTAVSGFLLAGDKQSAASVLLSRHYPKNRLLSKRAIGQLMLLLTPGFAGNAAMSFARNTFGTPKHKRTAPLSGA